MTVCEIRETGSYIKLAGRPAELDPRGRGQAVTWPCMARLSTKDHQLQVSEACGLPRARRDLEHMICRHGLSEEIVRESCERVGGCMGFYKATLGVI